MCALMGGLCLAVVDYEWCQENSAVFLLLQIGSVGQMAERGGPDLLAGGELSSAAGSATAVQ